MKYKITDQHDFTYHEGDLDTCTDYYNTYKLRWRKEGKLLSIKMEGLDE